MSTLSSDRTASFDGMVTSPPRKTQRRRPSRHDVTFLISDTTIQDTSSSPSLSLSDDEISLLWYTREEYSLIQKSVSFTVKLMERKDVTIDDDDTELCYRGLESQTRRGSRRKRQNVEVAVDTVLMEQEHQWETNVTDHATLARLYRNACAQCSMEAWLVAQKDAKAASPLPGVNNSSEILLGRAPHVAKRLSGEAVKVWGVPCVAYDAELQSSRM